jgi:hypothetical protein
MGPTERLIYEQDQEYHQSLLADRAKEKAKKEAAER